MPVISRNRQAIQIAAVVAMAFIATTAAALDADVGETGVCPDIGQITQADENRALPSADSLEAITQRQYISFAPEVNLTQASNLFDQISAPALVFGTRLQSLAISTADPSVILVRKRATANSPEVCGWASLAELYNLADLDPLLLRDLPGRENAVGIDGITLNALDAQAVARASRDPEGRLLPVPVFSTPNSQRAIDGAFRFKLPRPLSYFSVTYVLDVETDRNSDLDGVRCQDVGEEDCFLLLGGRNESGVDDVLGWVRGSDVDPWPSTLSLFYAPGTRNVNAYFSKCAAAEQILGEGNAGLCSDRGALTGSYAEADENNLPRYPIVGVERLSDPNTGEDAFIYEAIAPIGVCLEGSQREECRDASAAQIAEAGIQRGLDQLRNVDIMFVIDGSASMERFFEPALDAATDFADQVVANGSLSARFAAVVYSDYRGGDGTVENVEFLPLADFGRPGDTSNLAGLRATDTIQNRLGDVHKDQPEAPFAALAKAVDPVRAGWREDAGIRLVIWIADVGNRNAGQTVTKGDITLTERVTAQTVAQAAAAAEGLAPLVFSAVHVPSRQLTDIEPNREDFLADFSALAAALPPNSVFAPTILRSDDVAEARGQIFSALDAILTAVASAEACAAGDLSCEGSASASLAPSTQSDDDLFALAVGRALAERLGLVRSGTDATLGEGELIAVERVFIPYKPEDGDFDFWLGLRPDEMTRLVQSVGAVCDEMSRRQFGPQLLEGYLSVLETVTRAEVDRNLSTSEFLSKVLSVPRAEFSSLVTADVPFVDLLDQLASDDNLVAEFQGQMCRHANMLGWVRTGSRVPFDQVVWENGRVALADGTQLTKFFWDWTGEGGGNTYYFFPLTYLP